MATKFLMKIDSKVGRYYIAACNLNPGEVIFQEEPFCVGPKSSSPLICLGCHKLLEEVTVCDKCSWPVCNADCSRKEIHGKNECIVFSSAKVKFNSEGDHSAQLECIMVMRTLLESERNPSVWLSEVSIMESHTPERMAKSELWSIEQNNIVNFLYHRCKLGTRFTKDTIRNVCGILEVNCFELITDNHYPIRGLYPKLAILSHNCVANTIHSVIPHTNYKMLLRSTVEVKKDNELYSSYTRSTDPTLIRRAKLWETKYFHCDCMRCIDPTENGTHLNTLKCTICNAGLVITTNPLDNNANWKCTHCENIMAGEKVQNIYGIIQGELEELDQIPFGAEKIAVAEKMLKKYQNLLHSRHAFKVSLWHELVQLYGRANGYTPEMLPDVLLDRKAEMCKNLLDTYQVIEPGLTRLRGSMLYEYHIALLLLSRSQHENYFISTKKFKEEMKKVANILEEAVNILFLEPEGSENSKIAKSALRTLGILRNSIEKLEETQSGKQE